jgi:hypothetical protein
MKKINLIIPISVKNQIDHLHANYPNLEWCGLIFYTITETEETVTFTANFIVVLDLGSHAFTSSDNVAKAISTLLTKGLFTPPTMYYGMIHTHHTMGAFFSVTDNEELNNNAKNFLFYLSLVVDIKEEYVAKIGIPSKTEQTISTTFLGQTINSKREMITTVQHIDIPVSIEQDVYTDIHNQFLQEAKKEKSKVVVKQTSTPNKPSILSWDWMEKQRQLEKEKNEELFDYEFNDELQDKLFAAFGKKDYDSFGKNERFHYTKTLSCLQIIYQQYSKEFESFDDFCGFVEQEAIPQTNGTITFFTTARQNKQWI